MRRILLILAILILSSALIAPVLGAPKIRLLHRYTWDADLINTDVAHKEGYTGKGVYVA
ncbi:MAG: hypothetical protein QXU02_06660 [Candidatus Bathyarchaeia archaeon]